MMNTLHIHNELAQLSLLYDFLSQHSEEMGLNELQQMQVKLALDEIVTNVILYAYPGKEGQDIRIDMHSKDGKLQITITDSGIPFNPLEKEEPDLTLPAEERPIGGLGIFLVKQLMNEVEYRREEGKNTLILIKDID